ncbi:TetR/AcrR family transcriptional regulator [Actinomadura parmotrematis]|uniref:TetR/AcrR family transcriptional regulator n=1 Tax=Actinomadura parmotrematis TaxID=2864039 RepID=A0ABS7FRI8_9ACTN|nr:TetR/AcrR family transcriptional regulator [Actinomadura parmotrematis]MBW8483017.1 TetR/AcrR family transcriptional regulator [Actinomadura parmotrematis]
MSDSGSRLAEVYGADRPGLPRGRSSLPAEVVRAAQRGRLLRAMISSVAELGYTGTTVAGVVGRARVSRKAFYDHFEDLEDCLLAAVDEAERAVVGELTARREAAGPPGRTARDLLRSGLAAYLALCAKEPEYTRCLMLELPAAGPRALRRRQRSYASIAELLKAWHARSSRDHPEWPEPSEYDYAGAVGAVAEIVFVKCAENDTASLPRLVDEVTAIVLRVLAVPPDRPV